MLAGARRVMVSPARPALIARVRQVAAQVQRLVPPGQTLATLLPQALGGILVGVALLGNYAKVADR